MIVSFRSKAGYILQGSMLPKWEELPQKMRCIEVWEYYEKLASHPFQLAAKRLFDAAASLLLIVLLSPFLLFIALAIRLDSPGPVIFRQSRVTTGGRRFNILKFRTMVQDADRNSEQLTIREDARITRVGAFLRATRLDETLQLINIIRGEMSFVGTRPEVPRYVERYTPEMLATLLLPAGLTCEASLKFKNEYTLLSRAEDVALVYEQQVLPKKMAYNLDYLKHFNLWEEMSILMRTGLVMFGDRQA